MSSLTSLCFVQRLQNHITYPLAKANETYPMLQIGNNPFIPSTIVPSPKQQEFLTYEGLEALLVGKPGCGKTTALLMSALQYVDQPDYRAIILSTSRERLYNPGGLLEMASKWLYALAEFRNSLTRWTFRSGATLDFGWAKNFDEVCRYAGANYQFIGFDEVMELEIVADGKQLDNMPYDFMTCRLRKASKESTIPLRVRSVSNPYPHGHLGCEWAHRRFHVGTEPRMLLSEIMDNPHLEDMPKPLFLENPHA